MITASLHRSPTGPARRSARRLCEEELTKALRLGQLGLVRPPLAVEELTTALRLGQLGLVRPLLAATASSARRYGDFMATFA
jgi:hypothetical protein